MYALRGGEGVPKKAHENSQGGRGSLRRTYVHSCNFQTVVTCKESKVNETILSRLYTQDRILINIYANI